MSISFIVPCFNCADTLDEAIESIYEGNFCAGDEVILIDDNSTDNTHTVIERLSLKWPAIKSVRHNINKGSAAASRNTGIDICKNELLFCLDADNILEANSVPVLKRFLMDEHLDAAAFGEMRFFKKNKNEVIQVWQMDAHLNFIQALNKPYQSPCGSGNYLFTKNIWKKAGRYNESVGGAVDSEVFGLNVLAITSKFHTLPGYGYFHRIGYNSSFVKDFNKSNYSLTIMSGIMKHIDLIDAGYLDYMLGSGRTYWRLQTDKRPVIAAGTKKNVIKGKIKRRIFGILERL